MASAVLTVATPQKDMEGVAGGKGRNLYTLSTNGFAVPRWAILPIGVWEEFLENSGLGAEIKATLESPEPEGVKAQRIEAAIVGKDFGREALTAIEYAYQCAGAGRVAVRSSGADEDGSNVSFAGQYNTFLNVKGLPAVAERVKRCWASAYSERCLTYRRSFQPGWLSSSKR
jgi:rifampicin phosphotransferase